MCNYDKHAVLSRTIWTLNCKVNFVWYLHYNALLFNYIFNMTMLCVTVTINSYLQGSLKLIGYTRPRCSLYKQSCKAKNRTRS